MGQRVGVGLRAGKKKKKHSREEKWVEKGERKRRGSEGETCEREKVRWIKSRRGRAVKESTVCF